MQNNKKGERIMFDFLHRRKKINLKVTELTIILVLAGLCCSAISIVDESKLSWIPGNLGHYIIELSKRVYGIFLSSGIVSVIVEISSIKTIVEKGIKELIEGDFPMDKFSSESINKFHSLSTKYRCENPSDFPDNIDDTVYSLEKNLLDLLNGPYYEDHSLKYRVTPQNGNFLKRVNRKFTLVNGSRTDLAFKLWLGYKEEKLSIEDLRKSIKVEQLRINNNKIDKNLNEYVNISKNINNSNREYQFEVSFNFDRLLPAHKNFKKIKLDCTIEYFSSDKDRSYGFKLAYPCKKLEHEVIIVDSSNSWVIEATPFFSFDNLNNKSKISEVERFVRDDVDIKHFGWALPGDGYIVYFKKSC